MAKSGESRRTVFRGELVPYKFLRSMFTIAESTVSTLDIFDLKRAKIPTSPHTEQIAIASFITHEIAGLDDLTNEARRAIALLQEHRTALISATVTVQIDVRSLVASSVAQPKKRHA